ncbi:hypothetical protein OPV22_022608 [Ensete ventricosum]|uniref:DUF4005 domain-containing protein n=1 Tax=Ensete ventricosum TaxID=4639 RepID=A0AAV8PC09_ENSVE|nr:hypothetical protein OPV22_022608 [Ensete ventricosum]
MPSTKRRQQYTFRNTTTRKDFVVGEASGANESNTAPDEDRAPSDTLFPNHEGAKGHDDVAGRRRSESNDPVVHGSERTGSHDLDGHHATDASRSQEKYSTRRTLGLWGSDRNALRSRASEAGPGEGNLVIGGGRFGIFSESNGRLRRTLLLNLNRFGILAGKFK